MLQCGDVERLIKKRGNKDEDPKYYVCSVDTYEIVRRARIATGHGGRDRMAKESNKKYANITREALEIFKAFCLECQ